MTAAELTPAQVATVDPAELQHGTYAGLQQHARKGVPVCPNCREAGRQYMAKWRQGLGPEKSAREKADRAAYSRALWRLARIYPREFAVLAAEERAAGLARLASSRPVRAVRRSA